jgi:DNA-directed RNA polymerase II subunit RPB1
VLPVPPPSVRPSVKHDAQQRSEDDLTHIYSNIIKTNKDLQDKIKNNASANVIDGLTKLLQYFIAMIANNKTKGAAPLAQRSGRPYQCITSRLNSKGGRIRGNLMGKRVDFSARSVISGEPNLSIRQLGVPMKIAMNITKPVTVNDMNREFLKKLVQNGPEVYPGAKILERKNGGSISLRYIDRNSVVLENGDTVHRHMMDGDAVLFNRQPSLHRMSMMCHIAKIMKKGDTFRMNVGDTKPYNADFDGDEMNLHMPQNVLAETELRLLAAIPYQIISPASNAPIIGIYQDSLLGSFRFTRPNIKLTQRDAMNLLMMYSKVDTKAIRDAGSKLNSFDILSQIMAPVTLNYKTNMFGDNEDYATSNNVLEIRNGKYIRGQIEKSVLASTSKGILHRTFNDFGNMACSNFIDDLQNVVTEYMKTSSYSVGVSDLVADKTTQNKIIQAITKQKLEVQALIDKVHLGIFENNMAHSNSSEFELQVNNILNKARDESGRVARDSLSKDNRFLMIVKSGSKGNMLNISQMIAGLGQQNVDGKRIPYGFENRTLPHFCKYDDSPMARGFVENSYISGLLATELFFHAMGGRIGLIDTAVKTSQTGYIQRRLIKGLEDMKVEYDMTVRNNMGRIVQFAYGDDGVDSTRVENQTIPLVGMSIEDIYMHFDINDITNVNAVYTKDAGKRVKAQVKGAQEKCIKYINHMIASRTEIVESVFRNKNEDSVKMPVSFANSISNIQGQLSLNANSVIDITPLEAFELIEEYFARLNSLVMVKPGKLFEVLYYYYLSPKNLCIQKRFHRSALVMLLEMVVLKYKQSIVHPGEMVGVIAGQSIGEPTTQMTLNTFHLAGVASKSNVTRGVPRIEELLRLTNNPKNPSLTIHLKRMDETDKDKAANYANMIEYTKLSDLVKSMQICFDPSERTTSIEADKTLLDQFYEFEDIVDECNGGSDQTDARTKSKWIIRMEMDADVLLEKNITMDDIHYAISNSAYGENVSCVFSDYNSDKLVFRIRLFDINKKKKIVANTLDQSDEIYVLKNMQDVLLNSIVLRGVSNISKVTPRKLQNMVALEDGKYVRKDVWVLDTTGSNLLNILGLDFIDTIRTYSNDIREVCDVLGIEAARQMLFNEISEVMEFSDAYINYHHLSLLCDRMAISKNMVPIFRSGLLNDNIGPIAKATFEVHTEVLLGAARHAEFDHMRGVSASVMCGQYGKYGTGAFNVILDMREMSKLAAAVSKQTESVDDLFGISTDKSDGCSTNTVKIRNNISNIKKSDAAVCDDDYNMGFM